MAESAPISSPVLSLSPDTVPPDAVSPETAADTCGAESVCAAPVVRGGRRSKKRDAILMAARELFCAETVTGTSMDAVAARAGVSKATLYAHFPSKVDLFAEVLRQFAAARMPVSEDLLDLPLPEAVSRLAWRFLDLILTQEAMATYRTLLVQGQQFPELVEAFKAAGPEMVCSAVACYFQTLADRGQLRTTNARLTAEMFLHMVKGNPHAHALMGMPLSREQMAAWVQEAVRVFLMAYATPEHQGRVGAD